MGCEIQSRAQRRQCRPQARLVRRLLHRRDCGWRARLFRFHGQYRSPARTSVPRRRWPTIRRAALDGRATMRGLSGQSALSASRHRNPMAPSVVLRYRARRRVRADGRDVPDHRCGWQPVPRRHYALNLSYGFINIFVVSAFMPVVAAGVAAACSPCWLELSSGTFCNTGSIASTMAAKPFGKCTCCIIAIST